VTSETLSLRESWRLVSFKSSLRTLIWSPHVLMKSGYFYLETCFFALKVKWQKGILVEVPAAIFRDIISKTEGEASVAIRERVEAARRRQLERFREDGRRRRISTNSQMGPREVKRLYPVEAESLKLLEMAVEMLRLSARAFDRILKVARTVADLAGEPDIRPSHVAESIQYRGMDRFY
jgi:predicted ATPase with chaperone activity